MFVINSYLRTLTNEAGTYRGGSLTQNTEIRRWFTPIIWVKLHNIGIPVRYPGWSSENGFFRFLHGLAVEIVFATARIGLLVKRSEFKFGRGNYILSWLKLQTSHTAQLSICSSLTLFAGSGNNTGGNSGKNGGLQIWYARVSFG